MTQPIDYEYEIRLLMMEFPREARMVITKVEAGELTWGNAYNILLRQIKGGSVR